MTRTLLQWLGVAFVLGLVGLAAFALTVVKDRVRIVVQADAASTGPEPVVLLRDDLGVVARDLAELRSALGANLERLGNALEERAVARHADVQALARELAAVRQRLDAQAASLQRAEQQLLPRPEAAATAATEPAPVVAPPAPVAAEAAPAKTGGFLSFSLPATTFAFDREQRYQLVPELCRVGFDAKSTLHDFSGVTSQVAGQFTADFDDPEGAWRGEVTCEAGSLVTGVDGRDANMREYLATTEHPQIRFEIQRFVPAAGGVDVARQTARGEIEGRMQIRGVTRDLRMPVSVEVDASRRVVVSGQAPLKLSDYQVPVPSQLGVINMQDDVVIWISLRARVQVGDRK
ncbi:MAG: YceI family protein [Planctomycetes bacterium]|nr:YceI family protein [Planctomycetota bacterium]